MRPSGKLKRFISNADYQVSRHYTRNPETNPNLRPSCVNRVTTDLKFATARARSPAREARALPGNGPNQTLLPLHLSFCRTTLKNEASGSDANGRVFFALRTVTIDPRSTRIGLRPSSVRYTG
jgi:hypothetical protein